MTYNAESLSILSYANGFSLWHYRTQDAISDLLRREYFAPAHKMLRFGDVIYVHQYGMQPEVAQMAVLANNGPEAGILCKLMVRVS